MSDLLEKAKLGSWLIDQWLPVVWVERGKMSGTWDFEGSETLLYDG